MIQKFYMQAAAFFDRICDNRFYVILVGYGFFSIPYLITNHLPWLNHHYIEMTSIDRLTPFVPWTVWIYLTDYFLLVIVLIMMDSKEMVKTMLLAVITLLSIHYMFFIGYPTIYPRYDISGEVSGLTAIAFKVIYGVDAPSNCFPSAHVSISFIGALGMYHINRRYFVPFMIWASLISISTLTIKQHYAVDIVAAVLLTYGVHYLFWNYYYGGSREKDSLDGEYELK